MKKLLLIGLIAASPLIGANLSNAAERMTKEYCTSGQSGQEVSACLKEMRNSRAEKFPRYDEGNYRENQLSRCASVPDKALCEARIMKGTTSGEVKDGGTITELTVTEHPMHRVPKDQIFKYDPSK